MAAQPAHATYQPNQFDLFSKHVHVTYSSGSLTGKPLLTYTFKGKAQSFGGDQIRTEDTAIGRLVSVVIETVPDLHTVTFSFLLPTINVEKEAHIVTEGVYTTARTSIGGPTLVKGQVESWRTIALSGMARAVAF